MIIIERVVNNNHGTLHRVIMVNLMYVYTLYVVIIFIDNTIYIHCR